MADDSDMQSTWRFSLAGTEGSTQGRDAWKLKSGEQLERAGMLGSTCSGDWSGRVLEGGWLQESSAAAHALYAEAERELHEDAGDGAVAAGSSTDSSSSKQPTHQNDFQGHSKDEATVSKDVEDAANVRFASFGNAFARDRSGHAPSSDVNDEQRLAPSPLPMAWFIDANADGAYGSDADEAEGLPAIDTNGSDTVGIMGVKQRQQARDAGAAVTVEAMRAKETAEWADGLRAGVGFLEALPSAPPPRQTAKEAVDNLGKGTPRCAEHRVLRNAHVKGHRKLDGQVGALNKTACGVPASSDRVAGHKMRADGGTGAIQGRGKSDVQTAQRCERCAAAKDVANGGGSIIGGCVDTNRMVPGTGREIERGKERSGSRLSQKERKIRHSETAGNGMRSESARSTNRFAETSSGCFRSKQASAASAVAAVQAAAQADCGGECESGCTSSSRALGSASVRPSANDMVATATSMSARSGTEIPPASSSPGFGRWFHAATHTADADALERLLRSSQPSETGDAAASAGGECGGGGVGRGGGGDDRGGCGGGLGGADGSRGGGDDGGCGDSGDGDGSGGEGGGRGTDGDRGGAYHGAGEVRGAMRDGCCNAGEED
eukprot:6196544-Pleurochrysis_carterae.AAC.1